MCLASYKEEHISDESNGPWGRLTDAKKRQAADKKFQIQNNFAPTPLHFCNRLKQIRTAPLKRWKNGNGNAEGMRTESYVPTNEAYYKQPNVSVHNSNEKISELTTLTYYTDLINSSLKKTRKAAWIIRKTSSRHHDGMFKWSRQAPAYAGYTKPHSTVSQSKKRKSIIVIESIPIIWHHLCGYF